MTGRFKGWEYVDNGRRKRPARHGAPSSPAGKLRLLIAEKTEKEIRSMILAWEGPRITWQAVLEAVNAKYGGKWTRQALAKHPRLQKAFTEAKNRLKKEQVAGSPKSEGDGTVEVLQRQLRSVREDNEDLRKKIGKLEERFVRWKTNAYLNGWSVRKLDEALQKIDRGQSDKDR
jgi:hypothetical protein